MMSIPCMHHWWKRMCLRWLGVILGLGLAVTSVTAQQASPPASTPQDRFVMVNGLRLHYVDWGNTGATPFVMVHGLDRVARTFDHMAPHFTTRYHVMALDMRGHGDSSW